MFQFLEVGENKHYDALMLKLDTFNEILLMKKKNQFASILFSKTKSNQIDHVTLSFYYSLKC